jgi:hypothetical protein
LNNYTSRLIEAGFKKKKLQEYFLPMIFNELEFEPELLPFCDKASTAGILIFVGTRQVRAVAFELKKLKAAKSGAMKPIVCDLCYTLQAGSRVALITFTLNREKTRSVSYYVCADLACSLHVRGLSNVLNFAKSQIREDITIDDRILRLVAKSSVIFDTNGSNLLI